ncbi:MAG TPA: winged helix-turn-helix domain-containing protein [Terriglobales bacterium]|nr:winged helix-turn-helix domain-containing protein [Terriglobales bacterium]
MPQPDVAPPVVRFADFEVDVRVGELRKHGRRLRLQEQPLRVLAMLLDRPGELVSREELRLSLWPADTFVDFDHGLNSAVARLREKLNDSAEAPRYVETVPRKGYRFIGQVQELEPEPAPASPSPPTTVQTPRHFLHAGFHRPWGVLASVCFVFLLLVLRTHGFPSKKAHPLLPAPEVIPLAGLAGYEVGPAFSPDGNQVAFTEINGRQNSGIYTSLVGGEGSLRLTSNRGDCCVAWSPNSREVAFLRRHDDQQDIYVVPAIGGAERRLYSTARTAYPSLAWSPDGRSLAFSYGPSGNLSTNITLLSLSDSSTRSLTTPPDAYLDRNPAFSADGTQLAFIRGTIAGVANDVYVMPVSGGAPRRLTFDNRPLAGLTWATACGNELIYASTRGSSAALWRISASGGTPSLVSDAGLMAYSPSVSRSGNELAYQQAIGKDNIWRLNVRQGRRVPGNAAIAIAAKGRKLRPSFSPDGKRIAFESDRLGSMEIWICDSTGINCAQITSLHGTAGTARWSPDGKTIAFEFHPGEHSDVYTVDVVGGAPRRIPTLAGADNLAPSWSCDGKWLYFSSKRGGDPFELWKVPSNGGTPVQITHAGGIAGAESQDGKYLYYSKYETTGIWRMPLAGGPETRVSPEPDGTEWFNWGLAHNGIYFLNPDSEPKTTVDFFDFTTGKTRHLFALEKPWGWGLAVSPDSQSVLFVQSEFEEAKIVVVKNFH